MPQTVTIQRGSVSSTDQTVTTLFTLGSGGIASRIIVNYLVFQATGGSFGMDGNLIVNSASYNNVIGNLRVSSSSAANIAGVAALPSENMQRQTSGAGTNIPFMTNAAMRIASSSGGGGIAVIESQNNAMNAGSYIPKNFWAGPNDAIRIGNYLDGINYTVHYSFTVITES